MKRFLVWLGLGLMIFLVGSVSSAQEVQEKQKFVALTFDDGPRRDVLIELWPMLEEYNIKATFFINGYHFSPIDEAFIRVLWAKRNLEPKIGIADYFGPDPFSKANQRLIHLMNYMSKQGHSIQNHSYSHKDFRKMEEVNGKKAILEDIVANGQLIEKLTDRKPTFFRPPFGVIWPALKKDIEDLGYRVVGADIDSNDYLYQGTETREKIVPSVLKAIEEREKQDKFCHILLFHELPGTVKIMPVLIQELKARGYDFDTIEKVWLCQN